MRSFRSTTPSGQAAFVLNLPSQQEPSALGKKKKKRIPQPVQAAGPVVAATFGRGSGDGRTVRGGSGRGEAAARWWVRRRRHQPALWPDVRRLSPKCVQQRQIWPRPSETSARRCSANPMACLQVHTRPAPPIAASTCKSHLVFDSQIATGRETSAAHSVFDLLSPVSDLFHIWVSWAKLAAPA